MGHWVPSSSPPPKYARGRTRRVCVVATAKYVVMFRLGAVRVRTATVITRLVSLRPGCRIRKPKEYSSLLNPGSPYSRRSQYDTRGGDLTFVTPHPPGAPHAQNTEMAGPPADSMPEGRFNSSTQVSARTPDIHDFRNFGWIEELLRGRVSSGMFLNQQTSHLDTLSR